VAVSYCEVMIAKAVSVLRRHGDALWALLLFILITVEIAGWTDHDLALSIGYGGLATLPLALRRQAPLASFVLVMTGIQLLGQLQPGFDNDSMAYVLAFLHSLYSLGRHATGAQRWWGAAGIPVVAALFMQDEGGITHADLGDVAFLAGFVGAPWVAGLTIALRREREKVLHDENEQLRREQEERARKAIAEERARIARELHDVVSHAISVSVLQARGARATLGTDDDQVRQALDAIEQTNTAALSDMRRLLAVLRDVEPDGRDEESGHAPQPSLTHLDGLLDRVRCSGLPVELEVTGTAGGIPPGVDLSAYRIVQEALTNVVKHAAPARATVRLDYGDDILRVTVSDDGTRKPANGRPANGRTGQGLLGIRERVAVVGGSVEAGPLAGGGFRVSARLPYSVEAS
jgi:signal transduction histidine kinase